MKKNYILILILFLCIQTQAKKPKKQADSASVENNKISTIYLLNNCKKPANWFTDAWDAFSSLWQPVWGEYSEGGTTNRSIPLACADRKTEIIKYIC